MSVNKLCFSLSVIIGVLFSSTVLAKKGRCDFDLKTKITNDTGKVLISPQFEKSNGFVNGYAVVAVHGKFGVIDKKSNFIIEPIFDMIWDKMEDVELFQAMVGGQNGKFGLINFSSQFVVNPIYDRIDQDFDRNGMPFFYAIINNNSEKYDYFNQNGVKLNDAPMPRSLEINYETRRDFKTKKYGIFNTKTNSYSIQPIFDELKYWNNLKCESLIGVRVGDEKTGVWGFIDTSGKMIITPQYTAIDEFFSEGLISVNFGTKAKPLWGFIDNQGKAIITPEFQDAGAFVDGLAAVKKDQKCGYIDRAGNFIIPPIYEVIPFDDGSYGYCNPFLDGAVAVRKEKKIGFLMR